MLFKTRGIVFRCTRYGETSVIVNIFTEQFGLQSYIVNGVRNKSIRSRIALYQPLTLLELVVYHRENANILRIKEVKCLHPYQALTQDVRKSTIAMFLNEILNKTVKEQSHALELCDFLIESFIILDRLQAPENFHLVFLLKLGRHLGFGAQSVQEVLDGMRIDQAEHDVLQLLLTAEYDQVLPMSHETRANVLSHLLRFYKHHIDSMGTIKSVEVLKEVFS